jgi:uncharacterized repeat protein (TIGR03803 family)
MSLRFATLAFVVLGLLMIASPRLANGQTETTVYGFKYSSDGAYPQSRLVRDKAGNLYGTAAQAGTNNSTCTVGCGTVFELSPASDGGWTFQTLYSFTGGSDGSYPRNGLTLDSRGNLYGTTEFGGVVIEGACPMGCGAVFEISPALGGGWTFKSLHDFGGSDGYLPSGVLTLDRMGNLYGTTAGGGTVFKLSRSSGVEWMFATVYTFTGLSDGAFPLGGVILDASGNLYGTASGSIPGYGTAFELSPASGSGWTFKLLYTFQGFSSGDGAAPNSNLIRDKAGNFYGTTAEGGKVCNGCGTVFKLALSGGIWKEQVLHSFGGSDGSGPGGGLTLDAAGNLYGTTSAGGTVNEGSIFKLARQIKGGWNFTSLYSFTAGIDGGQPNGGVILDTLGNVYGTATAGGPLNYGSVFELVP